MLNIFQILIIFGISSGMKSEANQFQQMKYGMNIVRIYGRQALLFQVRSMIFMAAWQDCLKHGYLYLLNRYLICLLITNHKLVRAILIGNMQSTTQK